MNMKLSALQVLQILGMFIAPMVISSNVHGKDSAVIWSCVVIALLAIGVSICSVANAITERKAEPKGPKWTQ